MKRRRFLSLALALTLLLSLCACKTKIVDDDTTQGNAPVTGETRGETTTEPVQTTEAPKTTAAAERVTAPQRRTEKGKLDPNTGTYTGFSPLPKAKFTVSDPQNTRGLSTATVGYSFGDRKTACRIRTRRTPRNILTLTALTPSR